MDDQISDKDKHLRFNRLLEVVNKSCAKKNKEYEGRICEILVEGPSKNDLTKLMGRTRTGKLVNFEGDSELIGKLINVTIIKANSFSLIGEII